MGEWLRAMEEDLDPGVDTEEWEEECEEEERK